MLSATLLVPYNWFKKEIGNSCSLKMTLHIYLNFVDAQT